MANQWSITFSQRKRNPYVDSDCGLKRRRRSTVLRFRRPGVTCGDQMLRQEQQAQGKCGYHYHQFSQKLYNQRLRLRHFLQKRTHVQRAQ